MISDRKLYFALEMMLEMCFSYFVLLNRDIWDFGFIALWNSQVWNHYDLVSQALPVQTIDDVINFFLTPLGNTICLFKYKKYRDLLFSKRLEILESQNDFFLQILWRKLGHCFMPIKLYHWSKTPSLDTRMKILMTERTREKVLKG